MSSIIRKSYVLKKQFIGLPTEDDFEVVESTLPPISDGGKLFCFKLFWMRKKARTVCI